MREFKLADGGILEVDDDFEVINITVISDPVPRFRAAIKPKAIEEAAFQFAQSAGYDLLSGPDSE